MGENRRCADDYDDPMSGRSLGVAADVLRSFGSAFGGRHLAIVGGLVPGLLVCEPPAGIEPHVGTSDLDLHLSLHLLDGETADYYDAIRARLDVLVSDQFVNTSSVGPRSYSDFVGVAPGAAERRYAQGTVAALGAALRELVVPVR